MAQYPFPFQRIIGGVQIPNYAEFVEAVRFVTGGCDSDHQHNFAVQADGKIIHGSKELAQCVGEFLEALHG